MAIRRLTQEEIQNIIKARQSGATREELANQFQVPLSRIKTILSENGVVLDKGVAQANAYRAKLKKNPDAMQQMRQKIDFQHRSEKIREVYQDEELRILKGKQTREWWSNMTPEYRQVYLESRKKAQLGSSNNHLYFSRSGIDGTDPATSFAIRVKQKGGKLLGNYVSSKERVEIECENGHTFKCMPNSLQQGVWCPNCVHHISKGQQDLFDYVKSILNCEVLMTDRKLIAPKEVDIYVPSKGIAIEYHGLYWHSSAMERYARTSTYEKWKLCKDQGVQLITIFEDEWIRKQDMVKDLIAIKLGVAKLIKLNARSMDVVEVDQSEADLFFEQNHMSGSVNHKSALGLKKDGVLFACASFRRNFNHEFELARFATLRGVVVRGALGKILSQCKEDIVSYSDNRFSWGQVYERLGFAEVTKSGPTNSYYYTDGEIRIWRYRCRKDNSPEVVALYPTEESQAASGITAKRLFGVEKPLFRVDDAGHRKWIRKHQKR